MYICKNMTSHMYTQKYIYGHTHSYRYVIYNNLLRKIYEIKKEKVVNRVLFVLFDDTELGPYDDILGRNVSRCPNTLFSPVSVKFTWVRMQKR